MSTVRLVRMGQPGSRFTQKGDALAGRLGAQRLENSLIERLDKFINRH